jgi:hypothetical protein
MAITKSALYEDGMAGYEIDMFRKECGWDWVLLPKMVGGGRRRKQEKGRAIHVRQYFCTGRNQFLWPV